MIPIIRIDYTYNSQNSKTNIHMADEPGQGQYGKGHGQIPKFPDIQGGTDIIILSRMNVPQT